jgi:hypothetical protein
VFVLVLRSECNESIIFSVPFSQRVFSFSAIMKVQVTLKTIAQTQFETTICLAIFAVDIVSVVKERIAAAFGVAFPQADLYFGDEVLDDERKICGYYGMKKGSSLEFFVRATAATLAQQLADLLREQRVAMPSAELEMLYALKHGVTVAQSMELLGTSGTLEDFLRAPAQAKEFAFDAEGCAALLVQTIPEAGKKAGR